MRGRPQGASSARKQTLYVSEAMLVELGHEAIRQDRSLSWVVQQAWKLARAELRKTVGHDEVLERAGGTR